MAKSTSKQPEIKEDDYLIGIPHRGVVGIYRSPWQVFTANLIGGMAWGLGAVIGATLIVAVVIILLDTLGGVPVIGHFFHELAESIANGSPNQ